MPISSGLCVKTGTASLPLRAIGQRDAGPRSKRRRHRSPTSAGGVAKDSWRSSIHHRSQMFLETEHSNETQNPALFPSRTTLQLPVPSGRFLNAPDALDPQRLFLVIASDWNTISLYPRMTHYFSRFKSHLECHLLRGSVPAPPI